MPCRTTATAVSCGLLLGAASALRLDPGEAEAPAPVVKSMAESMDEACPDPAWLNECKSFFIDIGATTGVRARKFFEPSKYGGSWLRSKFDTHYNGLSRLGTAEKTGICYLGFEPDPKRRERLERLEHAYGEHDWRVHFYPCAVGIKDGPLKVETTVHFNKKPAKNGTMDLKKHATADLHSDAEEAAPVPDPKARTFTTSPSVDLVRFLAKLPAESKCPMMIIDIEGQEWDVLMHLALKDVICGRRIETMLVEPYKEYDGKVVLWDGKQKGLSHLNDVFMHRECKHYPDIRVFGDHTFEVTDVDEDFGW